MAHGFGVDSDGILFQGFHRARENHAASARVSGFALMFAFSVFDQ